jgi:hypothetical protein
MGQDFVSSGLIQSEFSKDTIITILENQVPETIDILFLISLVFLIGSMLVSSYFSKRMGYGEVFAWLTFGILVVLFISSIVMQISEWIRVIMIDNVLKNLTADLTFYNFYLSNYAIINALIIVGCVIANFIDLGILKTSIRKDNEQNVFQDEV